MFFQKNFPHIGVVLTVVLSIIAVPLHAVSADILDQQKVVDKARFTLATFAGHPSMTVLQNQLKKARAVFVAPHLIKGSFIFGGSFGTGVLLIRNEETQSWSDPAFYTMASGSFGFQFGAEASEVVLLVMTAKGVKSLLKTSVTLGAGARVAVGPVGGGIKGSTTPTLSVDMISYSRSRGAFGGFSFEGAVLTSRKKWNHSYYGQPVETRAILMDQSVRNHYSIGLLALITKASGGIWAMSKEPLDLIPSASFRKNRKCVDPKVPGEKRAEQLLCRLLVPQSFLSSNSQDRDIRNTP